MSDERDEIRSRIDIVELVGSKVALRRQGKSWKGLCPFHDDKNPSFTVDPVTGRYKCWSCGEAGDCFTWVMKTQHVEFPEALKELAERAGVEIKRQGPAVPKGQRDAHRALMNEALLFFRENLDRNPAAREYVAGRGLDRETVDEWELGYAPDAGEALVHHLRRKGHDLEEAKTLFLIDERDRGGFYDKFRGRLMFPIRDERGELVAFGGRVLGDGQPKYINSSDTPLYRKSRVLYGFHRARERVAKDRKAVLVEGYLDVIACHRAGENIAVASLGTALSEEQAKLLRRWCDEVTVLYDADAAGQKAAARAVELLRAEEARVRVALMPDGEDPDTLLRKAGPAAVRRAVEGGLSPLDFSVGQLETRHPVEEDAFWEELVKLLAAAPPGLEVERHLDRFSALYPGLRDPSAARRRLESMIATLRPAPPPQERPRKTWNDRPRRSWSSERSNTPPEPPPIVSERSGPNPIEACLFRAFFVPEYKMFAWVACRKHQLFMTGAGLALAKAIIAAFPTAPPDGPPAVWIAKLPEAQATMLADLNAAALDTTVTEPMLVDAIERLQRFAVQRSVRQRRQDSSPERLQETLSEVRALHPEPRSNDEEDDEDPFA